MSLEHTVPGSSKTQGNLSPRARNDWNPLRHDASTSKLRTMTRGRRPETRLFAVVRAMETVGMTYHLWTWHAFVTITFWSRRLHQTRWHRQKSHRQNQKHAHLGLSPLYKKSKARTSTAMLSRSSGSRCSRGARPCGTGTGKSSRLRHFRREKMRQLQGEYNQIGGGLVRLPIVVVVCVSDKRCS